MNKNMKYDGNSHFIKILILLIAAVNNKLLTFDFRLSL